MTILRRIACRLRGHDLARAYVNGRLRFLLCARCEGAWELGAVQ